MSAKLQSSPNRHGPNNAEVADIRQGTPTQKMQKIGIHRQAEFAKQGNRKYRVGDIYNSGNQTLVFQSKSCILSLSLSRLIQKTTNLWYVSYFLHINNIWHIMQMVSNAWYVKFCLWEK